MIAKMAGSLLTAWLLAAMPALAQSPAEPGASPRKQLNEDIEVLRRLLTSKVQSQYAPLQSWKVTWNNQCTLCHTTTNRGPLRLKLNTGNQDLLRGVLRDPAGWSQPITTIDMTAFTPPLSEWLTSSQAAQHSYNPVATAHEIYNPGLALLNSDQGPQAYWFSAHPTLTWNETAGHLLGTEGVYLKGQGVVYTLTLPPAAQHTTTEKEKTVVKPVSDWDRVRNEVRQEKQVSEEKKPPARVRSLPEIILQVLAENGQHFAQLGDNENITVVVTFRRQEALSRQPRPERIPRTCSVPGRSRHRSTPAPTKQRSGKLLPHHQPRIWNCWET